MSEINSLLSILLEQFRERCTRVAAENPEQILDGAVAVFKSTRDAEQLLAVDFNFFEYWRDAQTPLALLALYHLQRIDNAVIVTAAVIDASAVTAQLWRPLRDGLLSITAWLQGLQVPRFRLDQAVPLQPISIPKPWGREIWYTGIERRGVTTVGDAQFNIALPWLLAIAPRRLLGAHREPILLKILDPLPDAVFGDLYFEMHQQKQEVYVVTAIDARAWPNGEGAIRFGFNTELRAQYRDDQKFLADYLAAVRDYRSVRKAIDQQFDARRIDAGLDLDQPLSATTLQQWSQELSPTLQQQEQTLRAAMERFTGLQMLQIGDVVKVPCLVPHSLQHGVRTVEFQTPVYERLILSFAQKVLTQAEWDTDAAATLLCLNSPIAAPWPVTARGEGWCEEQIVEFDDFVVRRVTLEPGAQRKLSAGAGYALLMVVGAEVQLAGNSLAADTAVLLPVDWSGGEVANWSEQSAYLLLATPVALRG